MRIRPAAPADADALAAAHVQAWRDAYAGIMPSSAIESHTVEERREAWTRLLADPAVRALLVEDVEGVAGFALYGAPEESGEPSGTGELLGIYLVGRATGIGVGRELMAAAVAGLAEMGYGRAVLWVLVANARARRFYEAAGWRHDGEIRPHPVGDIELPVTRYSIDLASP